MDTVCIMFIHKIGAFNSVLDLWPLKDRVHRNCGPCFQNLPSSSVSLAIFELQTRDFVFRYLSLVVLGDYPVPT